MNYLYHFLIKIIISLLLMEATFHIWKMEAGEPGILSWALPFITIFWVVLTIVNAIQIQKEKKWSKEDEEDERDQMIRYKVGYITCWSNIGFLSLLFFFFGSFGLEIFSPVYALITVVFLNIVIYYGTKAYLTYFE
ncbi:putative membrane protein [Priestia megaterium]|uniref:hypothetical protein n=1 Tax=Priestia TaxID=2800373 RepID=UPI000BF81A86|nr:hypothetical protein [Priestia megaterium]RFB19556.1 hypothetical protein DZB87_28480 [Bacillus sp. ALD]MCM3155399.1 hypothetical protein [Priestia megaterium]PEU67333.1 hypothetical protein CN397_26965 [Priestia megaterium]PFQ77218.1 hypothetical protein COK11_25975 [Priestia megaterium]PFW45420.1 hypothetical protein COL17_24545 [Priestia megaterium]